MVAPVVTSSVPSSAPGIVTSNSNSNAQAMLMQAMLANLPANQQAPIAAAMALQAQKQANLQYMRDCTRKLGPTLTNGIATQAYQLNTPMTFNLDTALNGYVEGIIIRYVVNYTLAAGTSAVYAPTAAGKLGFLDTINVQYNKAQVKTYLWALAELAHMGAMDELTLPPDVLYGLSDPTLSAWLDPTFSTAVGANTVTVEVFVPFNLISPLDARGVLPLMAGDTGIQVVINTPLALLPAGDSGGDAQQNAIYPVSGTGHAISAVTGTVSVEAVYRDGDVYYQTSKLPFNIGVLEGTLQMQVDQVLTPLVANTVQRTKLNVMGYHYYVLLFVIDAISPANYSTTNNIAYIESGKDGIGGNTFWKYGLQTNLSVNEFFALKRIQNRRDISPGVIPMIDAPLQGGPNKPYSRDGHNYLDNTRTGWADWRYGVEVATVGALGAGPRIIPCIFYVNPSGLVPV